MIGQGRFFHLTPFYWVSTRGQGNVLHSYSLGFHDRTGKRPSLTTHGGFHERTGDVLHGPSPWIRTRGQRRSFTTHLLGIHTRGDSRRPHYDLIGTRRSGRKRGREMGFRKSAGTSYFWRVTASMARTEPEGELSGGRRVAEMRLSTTVLRWSEGAAISPAAARPLCRNHRRAIEIDYDHRRFNLCRHLQQMAQGVGVERQASQRAKYSPAPKSSRGSRVCRCG